MGRPLDKITVSGFKSIRSLEGFKLRNLNVLIGGNGAGKSNFIEIFRLLREMMARNLGGYVLSRGGADDFLFNGPKCTKEIVIHFRFDQNEYGFSLEPTADEKFLIKTEAEKYVLGNWKTIGSGISESNLPDWKDEEGIRSERGVGFYVYDAVSGWTVYHFHDTGATAPMRRSEIVEDCGMLRRDAANIAPFLLRLRNEHPRRYAEIVDAVRAIAAKAKAGEIDPAQIDEALLARHLYLPDVPDPDLMIRTSGELRLSNFLLWELSYAEFYFVDTLWPDFREADFAQALAEYSRRRRRFGAPS